MQKQDELSTVREILALLKRIHINPAYFAVPVLLSMGAATLEGVGMGLLIPMLSGFLSKDYSFIKGLPILHRLFALLPPSVTNSDRMLFVVLLCFFVLVILLKNVLRYLASVTMSYLGTRTVHHLRKQVFDAYLRFGKLYFDQTTIGHHSIVLSHFTRESLQPLLNVDRFIHALFSLIALLVVMLLISWKLTLVALPLFALLHFSVQRMIERIRHLSRATTDSGSVLSKKVVEILSTIPLIKAFGTEEQERQFYTGISDEGARLEFRTNILRQLIGPLQEVITLFAALTLLSGMLYLLIRGEVTSAPSFLVYFYLVINATNKFGVLTGFQSNLANASAPIAEVMAVFDPKGKHIIPDGSAEFVGLKQRIQFSHLTFSYAGDRTVLSDLTFGVETGQVTALVGPTGAGKTTIISLLMRFYDCPPATLLLDDTDIRSFSIKSLRKHMAVVSQDALLLHDTLRSNIAYGQSGVSDERVWDVVKRARLYDYVKQLPHGLATLVGDRGVKLSGGEKQRVSIARALLKGADILILDEATSSLDSATEKLIQEAIDEAIVGKTAIVIAHRLSTIKHADKIVVIERGRCVEQGTLATLLEAKGKFFSYWQEQKFS